MSEQIASQPPRKKRELPPLLQLSEAAAIRLRGLYQGAEAGKLLRVALSTKGCSGLSYDMSWVLSPGPEDEIVRNGDLTLLVDRKATLFLTGTTMDYQTGLLSSGFSFINPNEKGRCGCGESFHV
jgi:iron-sulfur cluster assembly protein